MIDVAWQLMAIFVAMLSGVFGASDIAFALLVMISAAFLAAMAFAAFDHAAGAIVDRLRLGRAMLWRWRRFDLRAIWHVEVAS